MSRHSFALLCLKLRILNGEKNLVVLSVVECLSKNVVEDDYGTVREYHVCKELNDKECSDRPQEFSKSERGHLSEIVK